MENPFGITREEVLELAANKLVADYCDPEHLSQTANRKIEDQIKKMFEEKLKSRIDAFLKEEMQKIVSTEIIPVNIWGEREGTPTTIRASLAKRAHEFWNTKVDKDGRESGWSGEERSKVLMKTMMQEAFTVAVKENIDVIVAQFKEALKADAAKVTAAHIDKLILLK